MATDLFNEFEPISSKQWKQQIQFELKGADYNETLVWESPEGIKVKPFYHIDEFETPISADSKTESLVLSNNLKANLSRRRKCQLKRQLSILN